MSHTVRFTIHTFSISPIFLFYKLFLEMLLEHASSRNIVIKKIYSSQITRTDTNAYHSIKTKISFLCIIETKSYHQKARICFVRMPTKLVFQNLLSSLITGIFCFPVWYMLWTHDRLTPAYYSSTAIGLNTFMFIISTLCSTFALPYLHIYT